MLPKRTRYNLLSVLPLVVILFAGNSRGALSALVKSDLQTMASSPLDLQVGVAGHAFDHLGAIGEQAEAAAASGANILYVTGLGALGYQGLPSAEATLAQQRATIAYLREAKRRGIRLAIGYVCATSMVKLDTFDKNWSPKFRAQFRTPPSAWRQQDREGHPLPSWYGGDYQPACMNNRDWRAYEKFIVRQQLEAGCDGIFFDNPTVHPQGCYCPDCMDKFAQFLRAEGAAPKAEGGGTGKESKLSQATCRDFAVAYSDTFLRFRCTVARDFLAEMRAYARTIKRGALITANNSFNSPEVLFSQCRRYGYNIYEMSQAEDFVVVEDESSQPRILPNGQTLEYGPSYKQLNAISHGKAVVAVTIAEGDYHTPPNLVRLAIAEAAANNASYLSWPTWPEPQRQRISSRIRPEADFLRTNAALFREAVPRRDVVLFLPFRNWLKTDQCQASRLAAELTRANIQYEVICEDHLRPGPPNSLQNARVLLASSRADFNPTEEKSLETFCRGGGLVVTAEKSDWLQEVRNALTNPSISLQAPPSVRALVYDEPKRTVVHLLNLNVQRFSSFEDKVTPASDVLLSVRVPLKTVRSVRALTADHTGTSGPLIFSATRSGDQSLIETTVPRLQISTIMILE